MCYYLRVDNKMNVINILLLLILFLYLRYNSGLNFNTNIFLLMYTTFD